MKLKIESLQITGLVIVIDEEKTDAALKQQEPETQPDPETKPKAAKMGRRKRVDRDKVMTLYTAKWSVEKIADEMGCSENTVRDIIREESK